MIRWRPGTCAACTKVMLAAVLLGACATRAVAPPVDAACAPSCQMEVENNGSFGLELIANSPDAGQVIGEVGSRQLRTFVVPELPRTLYATYWQSGQEMVRACRYRGVYVLAHRYECGNR